MNNQFVSEQEIKCSALNCNQKPDTKPIRLCKKHAKQVGISGFGKSEKKRVEPTKNIVKFDKNGYPICEEHGAMNCVNLDRTLYRCIACGVGLSFNSTEHHDVWLNTIQSIPARLRP